MTKHFSSWQANPGIFGVFQGNLGKPGRKRQGLGVMTMVQQTLEESEMLPMMQESTHNLNYTISTQAIERVTPSKDARILCKELSAGKFDANRAVEMIKVKYGLIKGDVDA